jgi:hypothetical protein
MAGIESAETINTNIALEAFEYVKQLSDDDRVSLIRHCKKHYSDICSNGDAIINDMIRAIESGVADNNNDPSQLIKLAVTNDNGYLIGDYLRHTFTAWENGMKADPWWAS